MPNNSDSDEFDALLENPLSIRKTSSRRSQRCDASVTLTSTTLQSNGFNKRNNKLSLSQRKRFHSTTTPMSKQANQLEEESFCMPITADQTLKSILPEVPSKKSVSLLDCDTDINGNATKKLKVEFSPSTAIKPTDQVKSKQCKASKEESDFSSVIDLVSDESSNTVPLGLTNHPPTSPAQNEVDLTENSFPFSTPINRNPGPSLIPNPPAVSPVHFLPSSATSSFSKSDFVQKWLETTETCIDLQTNHFEDALTDFEEPTPSSPVVGGEKKLLSKGLHSHVSSPSMSPVLPISKQDKTETSTAIPTQLYISSALSPKAGLSTPKRKRGPSTPRSSSGNKQTPQITSYFSPIKETPAKVNIKELNSPGTSSSLLTKTASIGNGAQAIRSSTKDQWAKLLPLMRGSAKNVQREMQPKKASQATKEIENGILKKK